jgi:hypothetical protein
MSFWCSIIIIIVTVVLSLLSTTTAFLFEQFSPKADLAKLLQDQTYQRVAVSLDIGQKDVPQAPRLAIKDMVLELTKDHPANEHVTMPGFNGPHPNLSAGLCRLNLIQEGSFITHLGQQFVKALMNGAWEFVWREGAPAGNLICGLELPEEVKRNGAILPKGKIYMTFPVWTRATLEQMQLQKDKIMDLASQALAEKDAELAKMQKTGNILQKALHYRNAFAAAEKYYIQPKKQYEMVPSHDEVISFQDDLLVTTKGTVWTKSLPNGKQVLLGAANMKLAPLKV